jgi:hypothetical protein
VIHNNIVIINKSALVTAADIKAWLGVENYHLARDFGPAWGVSGTVYFCAAVVGAWKFWLQDGLDQPGDLAYHYDDVRGQPDAFIDVKGAQDTGNDWRTIADHELKEALVDPSCRLLGADGITMREVCDPVEESLVMVGGVPFSNFVLPAYFGLVPGTRYDFSGILNGPCPALGSGGYIEQYVGGAWTTKWGAKAETAPGFMASRTNGRRAFRIARNRLAGR